MPTRGNKKKQAVSIKKGLSQTLDSLKGKKIATDIETTIAFIDEILGVNVDLTIRKFHVFGLYDAVIVYFCNMVNPNVINLDILKPLMYMPPNMQDKHVPIDQLKDMLHNDALYHSECKYESILSTLIESILRGETIVAVEGLEEAFVFETRSIDKRSIDQPATEQVIRGPREGFIEPLGTNISLIRYRLQSPDLRIETMELGLRTKSKVAVCYMEGLTNPELIKEVNKRLSKIDIDGILDSGYIEQFIEDNHYSPFP